MNNEREREKKKKKVVVFVFHPNSRFEKTKKNSFFLRPFTYEKQAHVASIASSPRASVVFEEYSELNGRVTVREAEFWRKEEEEKEGGGGKRKEKGGDEASSSSSAEPSSPPVPPPPRYRLLMFGDRHVQSVALMLTEKGREPKEQLEPAVQPGVLVAGYARAMAAAAVALCEAAEQEGGGGADGSEGEGPRRRGLLARDARLLVVGAGGGALPLALAEILSSVPPASSSPRSSPPPRSLVEAVEIDPVVLRAASASLGLPEAAGNGERKDAGGAGKKEHKAKATPESRRRRREHERARHRRHPPPPRPPPLPRKLLTLPPPAALLPPSSRHQQHLRVRLGDGFAAVASSEPSSLSAIFLDAFSGIGGGGGSGVGGETWNNSGGDGKKEWSSRRSSSSAAAAAALPLDSTSPVAFDDSFLLSAARALRPGGVLVANVMTSGGEAERRALVERLVFRSERAFGLLAREDDADAGGTGGAPPRSPPRSSFAFVALPPPSPLEEGNVIVAVVKSRRTGGETAPPPLPPLAPPTAPSAIAAAKVRTAIFEKQLPLDVEGLLGEEGGRLRPAAEWLRETEEDLRGFGGVLRSEL